MNMRPPEPLTPEERELAARIARLGPHGEPSPALDAKILAAAHSAVVGTPRKRRPRWPLYTGVAASALLAVGIAWQLRPTHEAAAPAASETRIATRIAQIEVVPAESASPPPPLKAVPPPEVVPPAPRRTVATPAPEPPAAPLAEPAPMADTAAGTESVAPAEPAFTPEPPVAAQRATSEREAEAYKAEANAGRRQRAPSALSSREYAPPVSAPAPPPPPAPATEAAAADSTSLDQVVVTGTKIDALAGIPAEEDAKLSKRKWLKRIEQRLEQDDIDGARESLRLFVGKYPQAELPPELRELLEE